MKNFKFMELALFHSYINIKSTDPITLSLIENDVLAIFPKCKTNHKELPSGKQYFLFLDKIGDGESVGWMILSQLCSKGWEPFHTETISLSERRVFLRMENSEP